MIDTDILNRIYQKMSLIRAVELRIAEVYPSDVVKSPIHLSIGQEAPSVGTCEALNDEDTVFGTYRSHALYLAKGGDLESMVAELYGKASGCGKGKAGSMHLCAPEVNLVGTSAIVATSIPQAVGFALAGKMKGDKTVTTVFFGDGAMEEGVTHESMSFAALHELPVIFICENNQLAIFTSHTSRVTQPNYCERASVFGMRSCKIEDNDVLKTYVAVKDASTKIRTTGKGPYFIEIETYRWYEHVGPNEDWHLGYRDISLREQWIQNDEIIRIASMLDNDIKTKINLENAISIDGAFAFAGESSYPDPEDLLQDVYHG